MRTERQNGEKREQEQAENLRSEYEIRRLYCITHRLFRFRAFTFFWEEEEFFRDEAAALTKSLRSE